MSAEDQNKENQIHQNWYNFDKDSDPISKYIPGIDNTTSKSTDQEIKMIENMIQVLKDKWTGSLMSESQSEELSKWFKNYVQVYKNNDWAKMEILLRDLKKRTEVEDRNHQNPGVGSFFISGATALLQGLNLIGSDSSLLKTADKLLGYDYKNPYEDQVAWIEQYIIDRVDRKYQNTLIDSSRLRDEIYATDEANRIKTVLK